MVLYYLQKLIGKSDWKVNGTILFESFQWEISRSKGMSETGSHVFSGRNLPNGNSCFISSKPTLIPVLYMLWRPFFGKWNWFVQMIHAIPGRNLPILNFAYRLHSQTVSQLVNAKHVFRCSVPEPHNSNSDDSNSPRTGTKSNFPWISPHFPVTFTRL